VINPVTVQSYRKSIKRFEMFECEAQFNDAYFHHNSALKEIEYHNAYDADENYSLFRADALISYERGTPYEVPVFACKKEKQGSWKWLIRFRPDKVGNWILKVRVICWHRDCPNSSRNEPISAIRKSSSGVTYWEHAFGFEEEDYRRFPSAKISFSVEKSNLPGPLEKPGEKDNRNYFYRWREIDNIYERGPFFLLGLARPWVVDDRSWDNYLNREEHLFKPMKDAGCNVLYHWMAPWESQLVHQSEDEFWFTSKGKYLTRTPDGRPIVYKNAGLSKSNKSKGYKRYDQGRARHLDNIFDLANKYNIQIFLSVMSHQSLQEGDTGTNRGHHWGEWGWNRLPPRETQDPSRLNGFQLFEGSDGKQISIEKFVKMDPTDSSPYGYPGSWRRRLWKHFANYWRYIIGRWTSHPALGAWILIDELEGVGNSDSWWWDNRSATYAWHDNLLALIKGKMTWEAEGKKLPYTGDYARHPITTSTTYYDADRTPAKGNNDALYKINNAREFSSSEPHGTWMGGDKEKVDFASHHAYHYVPTWGEWKETKGEWEYIPDKKKEDSGTWHLPNTGGSERIKDDRWLWDSLCMRLRNWGNANLNETRIITEYGCWERKKLRGRRQPENWNNYGKRNPSYTHFANWAALMLGHAGIPFKWNDGKEFGEMCGRENSPLVWNPKNYPINNYDEIKSVNNFLVLNKVKFDNLMPYEFRILSESGDQRRNVNAWGLSDPLRRSILVWIYDRTFESRGCIINGFLEIFGALENQTYHYKWFDTWAGKFIYTADRSVTSTDKGFIKIALTRFPVSSKKTVEKVSDGNDIAIFITAGS
jgi:hypothetical protein